MFPFTVQTFVHDVHHDNVQGLQLVSIKVVDSERYCG